MALIVDQQPNLKHFCKICKKGFGCGRALGGHMRAHGIGDDTTHMDDDEDLPSDDHDWEDKQLDVDDPNSNNNTTNTTTNNNNVPPTNNKCMYALRTNPNRLKSCRACENCGKEFLSWKSFLEHGKCNSEDAESLISSPGSNVADEIGLGQIKENRECASAKGWFKRKRSFRAKVGNFNPNCPSSEEEDLANCLMMLSNAIVDPFLVAEPEESCASASKDDLDRQNPYLNPSPIANFVAPISYRSNPVMLDNSSSKAKGIALKGLFECKACKKVFNSHQALGGHRASHKKVKGCFAARLGHLDENLADDDVITHDEFFPTKSNSTLRFNQGNHNNTTNSSLASSSKRKSKVHECSICHRVFSSGQALGGHKRCHWITSNAPETSMLARFHQFQDHMSQIPAFDNKHNNSNNININNNNISEPLDLELDLNLPAPANELSRREVSTEIYLQSWAGRKDKDDQDQCSISHDHLHERRHKNITDDDKDKCINNSKYNICMENADDHEGEGKVKLTKLNELKDMSMDGSSSPWLQVGIGNSTTTTDHMGTDP